MKKCIKFKKIIVLFILFFLLFLISQNNVLAITSGSQTLITPKKINEWDDGANVKVNSSGTGSNFHVSVTADTENLNDGYYSIYLFDYEVRSIKKYDGIRFNFKNQNDFDMKINLILSINSKVNVTMIDSSFAVLESVGQKIKEVIKPSYGTISIPAGFDGSILVPFSQLNTKDGEKVPLTGIQSWGITTVMSKDQKIQYEIGNITLLSGGMASIKNSYYLINLTGDNEITLPNAGSIIENYQAKVQDLDGRTVNDNVTFFLKDTIPGVLLSKYGKLELSSVCTASDITIYAKTANSNNYGKLRLSLKHSGYEKSDSVPRPEDVPRITSDVYTKLNESIILIRGLIILITLLLGVVFLKWFSQAKVNYSKIKVKLYKIKEQDEEVKL